MKSLSEGQFHEERLDRDYICIVHVAGQMPGVIHQVALRKDKLRGNLIRLGETPGDEFQGWRRCSDIEIIAILGTMHLDDKQQVICRPVEQDLQAA